MKSTQPKPTQPKTSDDKRAAQAVRRPINLRTAEDRRRIEAR